ncbi:MAG: right-handed parallel beta-helix repeat-containing protein, partial [Candidatus Methanoperedens sp.]|nr:right-handed parallel beta-helix repeat-containing protein [Candidatus Methanoperedens sp.]
MRHLRYKSVVVLLLILISAFVIIPSVDALEISACGDLTVDGAVYVLNQNVASAGTCFVVKAHNITLDGAGFTINYTQSTTGNGIDNTLGYDNITIKNLNIVQGNLNLSDAYAIYGTEMINSNIINNTIATAGQYGYGIYLSTSSNSNTLSKNTIITSGVFGYGIYLSTSSNSNILSNNTITTSGVSGYGIRLESSGTNTLSNNIITTSGVIGYGISLSTSSTNTISNNTITTSNVIGYGISLSTFSDSNTLSNNTIRTSGISGYGIRLESSGTNTLSNNTITTSNIDGHGIWLYLSDINALLNNTVSTSGHSGYGIWLESSGKNKITGGSIISKLSYDYYLQVAGTTNNYTNTNWTGQKRVHFYDTTSWFNYNNDSGKIWLKNNISAKSTITRTLNSWSSSMMKWTDNPSGVVTGYYILDGLQPNTVYFVYNTTGYTRNNPYTLISDANGNLPQFSIELSAATNTIIEVREQYIPPAPINLTNTTGNYWVNHTWQAGSGNVTNSYNVSVNGTWINGSSNTYNNNSGLSPHGWSNISVYSYNSSGTGALNTTPVLQNTHIPNNLPVQQTIGSKTVYENQTLSFAIITTDADGDTITYGTNATRGSLNTATGIFIWTPTFGDSGIYVWYFNSTDNYNAVVSETITVTVINVPLTITSRGPGTDPTTSQGTAQTFNVTLNRRANVIWYINWTSVQTNKGVTSTSYTNSIASAGYYNVILVVSDAFDTTSTTWNWIVTSGLVGATDITSWGNNKTNDDSLMFTINTREAVRFNATANRKIDKWNWLKDDVNQDNNFDNFTANFTAGTHTIKVSATNNSNGTSNT